MEGNAFIWILTILYGISGAISMIAYFPTIKDLMKGIPSANFYTYALRFLYYLISVLYGIFVLKDWLFIIVSGLDTVILLCIVVLIIRVQRGEIVQDLKHKKVKIQDKVTYLARKKKAKK